VTASVGVVDYGMGNRRSVQKALERVGARATVTHAHDELNACDGLVIPGVGAFPLAIRNLRALGLDELLRGRASQRTPVLGVCLGMQLLFEVSDELGRTEGLALIEGAVTRLDANGLRVPHIGWNDVRFERESPLTAGLPAEGCPFYHVHSLAPRPSVREDVVGTSEYGERFATIVQRGNVFGVQFHPEKSSAHGLELLANFVAMCAARPASPRAAGQRA
jgi:imidazole glycerol-phosphate synthase subunit HisH